VYDNLNIPTAPEGGAETKGNKKKKKKKKKKISFSFIE